jgi:hypothetical protein
MEVIRPPVHGDKLRALALNGKLPRDERARVEAAIKRYDQWIGALTSVKGNSGHEVLKSLVEELNGYKRYVEVDLIFDAENDFLYRQKGQLKLDNTVLEEFLPYLFDVRIIPGLARIPNLSAGPQASFAGLSFASPFLSLNAGGVYLKLKDQDFSVTKSHVLRITDDPDKGGSFEAKFSVSHFATEIKTNLDKTMFQEASQTAAELKRAVPGSTYTLLCEFLDMTPITTKLTSIDEVIVLRKAKRLASNIRAEFSTAAGRKAARSYYVNFLDKNPLRLDCFERFIHHLMECFPKRRQTRRMLCWGGGTSNSTVAG